MRYPTSLAAKLVSETDDFSAVYPLLTGETISSATAACSLEWGTDAAVASMAAAPSISGDTVTSRVTAGVTGNLYRLRLTATLSTARVLISDVIFEVRA